MQNNLEKRYGLITAIAMVIGIVIGSGVFFKAEKILKATGANMLMGVWAWIIGGIVMISCAYVFANLGTRYEKVNGLVDYAEAIVGKKYAYWVGWFMTLIYYPTLTSVLAWVSARYTAVLFGWSIVGPECMVLSGMYLVMAYALNALSPVLAGKFQVSSTVIKLIPLGLMAIVGTIAGLNNGMLAQNFIGSEVAAAPVDNPLFAAVVATAFAYEGWIVATTINSELKDAKRNLPLALIFGTLFVMVAYVLYYIGLAGVISIETMISGGEAAARIAFSKMFSSQVAGTILFVFIVISCLGTLNGLMLGCTRGLYSLAVRSDNPALEAYKVVDIHSRMAVNSAIIGLLVAEFWLVYFYGANLTKVPWFGNFSFDSSELPIITLYAMYIPIFILMMKKEKGLGFFKGTLTPFIALLSCIFMVVAAYYAHGQAVFYYLVIFAVIMACGIPFQSRD